MPRKKENHTTITIVKVHNNTPFVKMTTSMHYWNWWWMEDDNVWASIGDVTSLLPLMVIIWYVKNDNAQSVLRWAFNTHCSTFMACQNGMRWTQVHDGKTTSCFPTLSNRKQIYIDMNQSIDNEQW